MLRRALYLAALLALATPGHAGSIPLNVITPPAPRVTGESDSATDGAMEQGNALLGSGDYPGAIAAYTRGILADPNWVPGYLLRACAYQNVHDLDHAIADATKCIELDPKYANAYIERGTLYDQTGEYEKDIADQNAALKLSPDSTMPRYERGCAEIDSGQYDNAIADFQACLKPVTSALALNGDTSNNYGLVMTDSEGWRPQHYLGVTYLNMGEYAQAEVNFTAAIQNDPKSVDDYVKRAAARDDQGQRELALADFAQALALDPQNADVYNNRGSMFLRVHELAPAITDFQTAVALDPKNTTGWYNLGLASLQMRDLERAIADFTRALEIDPGMLAARRNRGCAYGLKGDYIAMLTDFGETFAHESGNGRVTSDLALTYARMGDYPDAIAAGQLAIALNPSLNGAYNNLAWLLATCPDATYRDGQQALTDATQACKLTGWRDSVSVDTFAAACAASGDFDAAVKWERASMTLPGLTPSDIADAQKRLTLYQSHQTYQEDPTQFLGEP